MCPSPETPDAMDWSSYYPAFMQKNTEQLNSGAAEQKQNEVPCLDRRVEIADIGCGYGGLLFALASKMPQTLILGIHSLYFYLIFFSSNHFPRNFAIVS